MIQPIPSSPAGIPISCSSDCSVYQIRHSVRNIGWCSSLERRYVGEADMVSARHPGGGWEEVTKVGWDAKKHPKRRIPSALKMRLSNSFVGWMKNPTCSYIMIHHDLGFQYWPYKLHYPGFLLLRGYSHRHFIVLSYLWISSIIQTWILFPQFWT